EPLQGRGQPGAAGVGGGQPAADLVDQEYGVAGAEGRLAGDQPEQRGGQAVDVQRGRQGPVERLRGHVGDGAGDGGRVGEVGRDAEVGEQGLVLAAVPEDVGRLDVPVDDAEPVDLAQAVGDIGDVAGGQGPGQRPGAQDALLQ